MKYIILNTILFLQFFCFDYANPQSQGVTKLIFQRPKTMKQYYLTVGDMISFVTKQKLDNFITHGEILAIDSIKYKLILFVYTDDVARQRYVHERTEQYRYDYFKLDPKPGEVIVEIRTRTIPAHYEPINKQIEVSLDIAEIKEISSYSFKMINSSKEFHKRVNLNEWRVKIE